MTPDRCIPDPNGNPYYQQYQAISNWNQLRQEALGGKWLKFTLTWSAPAPQTANLPKAELVVTSDGTPAHTGTATIVGASVGQYGQPGYQANGLAVPTMPLRIRLNSNPDKVIACEDWRVDYVRFGPAAGVTGFGTIPQSSFNWQTAKSHCRPPALVTNP
jgi:hypothetical protein